MVKGRLRCIKMKKLAQYKRIPKVVYTFVAIFVLLIITAGVVWFSKNYICEVKKGFNYKGQHYTCIDNSADDEKSSFTPFGSNHCNFIDDLSFKKYFFLEYYSEDSERLFFYDFTPFGNYIFKKDSYIIPDKPEPQSIDFIMITYDGGEKYSYIYNKNDINTIMSYFNDIKGKVSSDYTDAMYGTREVWIVASSKKYSGMFDLTADNRSVCQIGEDIAFANNSEKFSSDVSKVIMSYYSASKNTYN